MSEIVFCPEAHEGIPARSVGWLGEYVPRIGRVSEVQLDALLHFAACHAVFDEGLGLHTCEICAGAHSHGEFWVELEGARFVLPRMLFHYVDAHGYAPPGAFLDALDRHWASEEVQGCREGECAARGAGWTGEWHAQPEARRRSTARARGWWDPQGMADWLDHVA